MPPEQRLSVRLIPDRTVRQLVISAFQEALATDIRRFEGQSDNSKRSAAWIECLANSLHKQLTRQTKQSVVVFRKTAPKPIYRKCREFLLDIAACQVHYEAAPVHKTSQILYIDDLLFAVESELYRSTAESVFDANKLRCSSARQNLFVGPLGRGNSQHYRTALKPLAGLIQSFFAAFIPRPELWRKSRPIAEPLVFSWDPRRKEWRELG